MYALVGEVLIQKLPFAEARVRRENTRLCLKIGDKSRGVRNIQIVERF